MSWRRRTKSTGWAALSLQQKQKQSFGHETHHEPFPDLPGSHYSPQSHKTFTKTNKIVERPFSSVALPSTGGGGASFPAPFDVNHTSSSLSSRISREEKGNDIAKQLKELYVWADESLIEDILTAVDGDFERASSSLKAMISDKSSANIDDASNDVLEFWHDEYTHNDEVEASSSTASSKPFSFGALASLPVEPEWEEDDMYLSHRKDAIRIMREASRHSKAAAHSFMRGDHFSAQQLSQKAREEWAAAKVLHEKAACEILSLRNEKNGIWKLDLHGLHASEAVKALQERLRLIESQVSSKSSIIAGRTLEGTRAKENGGHDDAMHKVNEELLIRRRPVWLEVITGVGNHSRGEAAIPAAVRTFLLDHSYRFDEARPGIVMVRPKFRQR